jgi:lysophospholipase L1-like esterase
MAGLARKLAVSAAATIVALTAAEAVTRAIVVKSSGATDFESYRLRCLGEQLSIFERDEAGELIDLQPGTRQGNLITINRQGFRGKPVAEPKPEEGFRICCIGGSGCFGTASSGDAKTFPAQLEQLLRREARAPERVEVINGGLPGATTARAVSRFEKRLATRKPDVVILYNLINDLLQSRRAKLGIDPRRKALVNADGPVSRLLSHSAMYLAVASSATQREKEREIARANAEQTTKTRPGSAPGARAVAEAVGREAGHAYDGTIEKNLYIVPEHFAEFRSQLARFHAAAKAAGAVPVFCTFALRFEPNATAEEYQQNGPTTAFYMPDWPMARDAVNAMNDAIREAAAKTGSLLIDVAREIPKKTEYFPPRDTDHFTDAGCAAAAAIIAKALREKQMLTGAALPK